MSLDRLDIESLYIRLEKPLYNLSYRWLWNEQEAMEIVQETFVRLWKKRQNVDFETAKAYTFKICLNLSKNKRTRNDFLSIFSKDQSHSLPSMEISLEEVQLQSEENKLVEILIQKLPKHLKDVVLLCELSELSYQEVSEILKIPLGTVGSRRNKALKILKERLTEQERGYYDN